MFIRSLSPLTVLIHALLSAHCLAEQCYDKVAADSEWIRHDEAAQYTHLMQKKADAKRESQLHESRMSHSRESSLTDLLKFAAVKKPTKEEEEGADSEAAKEVEAAKSEAAKESEGAKTEATEKAEGATSESAESKESEPKAAGSESASSNQTAANETAVNGTAGNATAESATSEKAPASSATAAIAAAAAAEELDDVLGGWYLGNDGLEVQVLGDGDPRILKTLGASYNLTNIKPGTLDIDGPYGGGSATWDAKMIIWANGLVHVKEDFLAWRYLPYINGGAVRCGAPMQIVCPSEDGANCAWGKYGNATENKPWADISNKVGNYNFNQTVALDCPGWMLEDGTNPCLVLGCYKAVQFGVYVKNMYQIDMSKGTFTADIVLTFKWRNPESRNLVLGGVKSTTMPSADAKEKMWMPDLAIANRDISQTEVVSSSVQIWWDGSVKKVERVLCTLRNDFDPTAFPFDEQILSVILSSTNKMTDQLQLTPLLDPGAMSANKSLFDNKDVVLSSTTVKVFNDTDAQLRKSRGVFTMKVTRKSRTFVNNVLIPSILVTMVGCTAFYFPLDAIFTMPRVATTLIGFLTLVTIRARVETMMPLSPTTWLDVMFGACVIIMLLITVTNVFVEYLYNMEHADYKDLAQTLNNDLKILFPCLLTMAMCVCFVDTTGTWVSAQYTLMGVVFAISLAGLCWHVGHSMHQIKSGFGNPSSSKSREAAKGADSGVEEPPKFEESGKGSKGTIPAGSKAGVLSASSSYEGKGTTFAPAAQPPRGVTRGRQPTTMSAAESSYSAPGRGMAPSPPTSSYR